MKKNLIIISFLLLISCSGQTQKNSRESIQIINKSDIINTYPHDEQAYTQGLEFRDNKLLESTGLNGESSIRITEPETGKIINQKRIADEIFAEGTTFVNNDIYQLTWKNEKLFIRDENLNIKSQLNYEGQGWGICYDGKSLYRSDGTDTLKIHLPKSFEETSQLKVESDQVSTQKLNELECVDETIWANIYQTNYIIAINKNNGKVERILDLTALVPKEYENSTNFVLNGIAYNTETSNLWVTGKKWPKIYEIDIS